MSALQKVPQILAAKGWALYHLPYYNLTSTDELMKLIKRGPELKSLTRYELYLILPLLPDPTDAIAVLSAMDSAWATGRLPVFVKIRYIKTDKRTKPAPVWIMPIDSLGVGDNDEVVLVADPNVVAQYLALLKSWEHPLDIAEGEVHQEGFSLTYYCQADELNNFISFNGKPLFATKEAQLEYQAMVAFKAFSPIKM